MKIWMNNHEVQMFVTAKPGQSQNWKEPRLERWNLERCGQFLEHWYGAWLLPSHQSWHLAAKGDSGKGNFALEYRLFLILFIWFLAPTGALERLMSVSLFLCSFVRFKLDASWNSDCSSGPFSWNLFSSYLTVSELQTSGLVYSIIYSKRHNSGPGWRPAETKG